MCSVGTLSARRSDQGITSQTRRSRLLLLEKLLAVGRLSFDRLFRSDPVSLWAMTQPLETPTTRPAEKVDPLDLCCVLLLSTALQSSCADILLRQIQ
jgi:hypothetical protein